MVAAALVRLPMLWEGSWIARVCSPSSTSMGSASAECAVGAAGGTGLATVSLLPVPVDGVEAGAPLLEAGADDVAAEPATTSPFRMVLCLVQRPQGSLGR